MTATLAVKVTPKSGKDQVVGIVETDGLREVHLRVTAPPEGGKANKSVIKLLSKELGVPKTDIQVKRGDTSHHKMLELDCEQSLVDAWVASLD
ncbi:MAG: DUF167 domain-containing protein [Eggerthellales bacterium]|nr:DUF167 domain-containing protein [Eggerthellales bacterium]